MLRPDISSVDPEIKKYIEYLEKKLGLSAKPEPSPINEHIPDVFPPEAETTNCIISISAQGNVKRTYRHLYTRQHRGGMGVFDLETNLPDYPFVLGIANEPQTLLLLTNRARAFRYPLQLIESAAVHARGVLPFERMGFDSSESIAAILPEQARGYVALLGASGKVRLLRHHLFGEHMKPGTVLFNTAEFGALTSACWTPGDAEIFIVTSAGMGIRFAEKAISPQGDLGIRTGSDDSAVGITSVSDESNVFFIGADGRGTVRQMSNFAANKSAGGSGKIAFKNNKVVGASSIAPEDEIFVITRYGKIIRFMADEVPVTEGPVQGVSCISLRADEVTAFTRNIHE
jgi:DNA gyrase subunit A